MTATSDFSFLVSRFSFLVSRFSFLVSRFSFLGGGVTGRLPPPFSPTLAWSLEMPSRAAVLLCRSVPSALLPCSVIQLRAVQPNKHSNAPHKNLATMYNNSKIIIKLVWKYLTIGKPLALVVELGH